MRSLTLTVIFITVIQTIFGAPMKRENFLHNSHIELNIYSDSINNLIIRGRKMLNIIYGEIQEEKYIFDPDTYFDNTYEDEWITDPLTVEMIRDVDKSEVIGPHLIESPYLGPIPIERLSGGVKTLILINQDSDHIFNASACGNNCAKWLIEIGNKKDVTVRLGYFMDFGEGTFSIRVVNTGFIAHNSKELDGEILDNNL